MLHIYVFPKDYRSLLEILTKIYGFNAKNIKNTLLEGFWQILTISPKTSKKCKNSRKLTNS